MINEIWKDGILIETIDLPDEPQAPEPITLTTEIIEQLKTELAGATTIAKLRSALENFVETIEATQ